jgi:hypothetical protein
MSTLVFSTTSLPSGTAGIAYSNAVVATGGITPYTYSAAGLPNGLVLNTATGAITGTPSLSAIGPYSVAFSVVDSTTPTAETATTTISLAINPTPLQDAITLGYIEEDLTLTLAWNPAAVNGGYSVYNDWNIWLIAASNPTDPLLQSVGGNLPTGLEFGGTLSSRSFRTTVTLDGYSVKMQALSADPDYADAPGWTNYLSFPSVFTDSSVAVDLTTAQINQPVLISLSGTYTGASQWRLVFSTGATAWLPISVQTVSHIFGNSGAVTFSVEVQNDYSTASPAVQLRRSITKSIFVSNSVWVPTQASSEIITGTVGMYGTTGFEITDALAGGVPEPYAVIMRSLVRDTVTNELKLLVALSRYQNASSILGTMAADVFPLIGRPQVQDLMDITPALTAATSSSSPVVINSSNLPLVNAVGTTPEIDVIAGLPMGEISFTASGGIAPYSWYAADLPYGLKFSIDGTLTGTPMVLGIYQCTFSVSDSSNPEFIDTIVVDVAVRSNLAINTTGLPIINGNVYLPSAQVMASYSYQMLNTGGIAPFTWSVTPGSVGSLPNNVIVNSAGLVSGYPTTDNSTTDFTTPFFVTIQVADAIGAVAMQYFGIDLTPATLTLDPSQLPVVFAGETFRIGLGIFGGVGPYTVVMTDGAGITSSGALIDGRWEFLLTPTVGRIGIQTLSFLVTDSASHTENLSVSYTVGLQVANVGLYNPIVDHLWESGDTTTTVSLPLDSSNLSGLTLGSYSATSANGISITLTSGDLIFQQIVSPSFFGSANGTTSVPILAAGNQVATVSHEYTVENSNSATLAVVGGNLSSSAIPYLVGNLVTLNPLKPFFNSPSFGKGAGCTVSLATGSFLPGGLSLDSSSGLIYGYLTSTNVYSTVLNYIVANVTTGTVTITWNNYAGVVILTDNLGDPRSPYCTIQLPYSGSIQADRTLSSVSIVAGRLPVGITAVVNSVTPTQVTVAGTTTESGYFDVWFKVIATTGAVGFLYKRFVSKYVTPLAILTGYLDQIFPSIAYSDSLQGVGGVGPYTWTLTSGSLPSGFTPSTSSLPVAIPNGIISGTTALTAFSSTLGITLTDSRGVKATTSLPITLNDSLIIINTSPLPSVTQSAYYNAQMSARGGSGLGYTWSVIAGGFPAGITMNSSGAISGLGPATLSGPQSVTIQVVDSLSVTTSEVFTISVTVNTMSIDISGVGPITRAPYGGQGYIGTLGALGGTPPYTWNYTGVPAFPNYLQMTRGSGYTYNGGLSGTCDLVLTAANYTFMVQDSLGQNFTGPVPFTTVSSVKVTTIAVPDGIAGGTYSTTLAATTNNPPIVSWALTSGSLPTGLTLSSGGVISGTPSATDTSTFTVTATDSLNAALSGVPGYTGDTGVSATLSIRVQNTTLVITTSSLPNSTAGVAYSAATLTGTGGVGAYSWSIDPSSAASLSSIGMNLNASTGAITGTSTAVGTYSFTFRLTDSTTAYVTRTLSLTVASNLYLVSGPDYVAGGSPSGFVGGVDAGNISSVSPRPNMSFYVVATGVISTSTSTISASTSVPGVSATVTSVTGSSGSAVALIQLTGSLVGSTGSNNITVSVIDKGISKSVTFQWLQYTSEAIYLVPASGSIPTYYAG